MLRSIVSTLSTRVFQQVVAIVLFLTLPNILSAQEYAGLVYVTVLLSFLMVSDMGITQVYSRDLPGLNHLGSTEEVDIFMSSVFWFSVFSSLVFGFLISMFYLIKFDKIWPTIFLVITPLFIAINSFLITTHVAKGEFKAYGKICVISSILKLSAIPLAFVFGLAGWLNSIILAGAVVVGLNWKEVVRPLRQARKSLIIDNLVQGVKLSCITFVWIQMIGSARMLAAFFYGEQSIAEYGLLNSGYQIVVSLLIAIHLPVTVEILKKVYSDRRAAAAFVFSALDKSQPIVIILALVGVAIGPPVLRIIFPAFDIDARIVRYTLYSLGFLPPLMLLGNLHIGTGRVWGYLSLLVLSFAICIGVFQVFYMRVGNLAAAIAQFVALVFLAVSMLMLTLTMFHAEIDSKLKKMGKILAQYLIYFGIMFYIERGFS